MEIISCFVREQQRYTKKELCNLFSLDSSEVEKFIKNLKSYGLLSAVTKTENNKDLTDLLNGEFQIIDAPTEREEGFYVFTFVGVIIFGCRVIKVFPKYILSEKEPLRRMKQVIKVLEQYSHSKDQRINFNNGNDENNNFNLLEVILYLLHDFYEYGLYSNDEDVFEINGEGDIVWHRTLDEGFAIIQNNCPYYTELITRKSIEDDMDYFKRLHKCILTECSKQIQNAGLDKLFDIETVVLSDETLEEFGEKEYILNRIDKELSLQFNTHRQVLLKTLYVYISQDKKLFSESQSISIWGTTAFYSVWEDVCSRVFDNKLNMELCKLPISTPLADGYNKKTKLIELIDKPKWHIDNDEFNVEDTLVPDIITVTNKAGIDQFFIMDAKYYILRKEKRNKLSGNPGIGDITKQYMYQLAYKKFLEDHHISVVKNYFLLPSEEGNITNRGIVKLPMLSSLGLEDIQIVLLPCDKLFDCYLRNVKLDIALLNLL